MIDEQNIWPGYERESIEFKAHFLKKKLRAGMVNWLTVDNHWWSGPCWTSWLPDRAPACCPIIHPLLSLGGHLKGYASVPVVPSLWNVLPPLSHYSALPYLSDQLLLTFQDEAPVTPPLEAFLSLPPPLPAGGLMYSSLFPQLLCKRLPSFTRVNLAKDLIFCLPL